MRNLLCEIGGNSGPSNANIEGKKEREDERKNNDHMHIFNFESILAATDDFSSANILGEGGFGTVYKVNISTIAIESFDITNIYNKNVKN